MRIEEVSPDLFSEKFGEDSVLQGVYDYFICSDTVVGIESGNKDELFGVRKDSVTKSIEVIPIEGKKIRDLEEYEEVALLRRLCGEFKPEVIIPHFKGYYDYMDDYKESQRLVYLVYFVPIFIMLVMLVIYLLVFH